MTILAALLLSATFNGCPADVAYWPPLVVQACGQVYVCKPQGMYSGGVLSAPSCVADRVFKGGFQ